MNLPSILLCWNFHQQQQQRRKRRPKQQKQRNTYFLYTITIWMSSIVLLVSSCRQRRSMVLASSSLSPNVFAFTTQFRNRNSLNHHRDISCLSSTYGKQSPFSNSFSNDNSIVRLGYTFQRRRNYHDTALFPISTNYNRVLNQPMTALSLSTKMSTTQSGGRAAAAKYKSQQQQSLSSIQSNKISDYYIVIVESPSKCKTIESILNKYVDEKNLPYRYKVMSCMGHVRDLVGSGSKNKDSKTTKKSILSMDDELIKQQQKEIMKREKELFQLQSSFPYNIVGIDLLSGQYKPIYDVVPAKRSLVHDLQREIHGSGTSKKTKSSCIGVLLATDPDREGEAMAWHLSDVLGLLQSNDKKNSGTIEYKRMRFTEITPDAIIRAVEKTFDDKNNAVDNCINYNLVSAQETRRVLDRLAGFTVSPILWKKIAPGLSAGRVQSVGMALTVRRERERLAFQSTDYWNIQGQFHLPNNGEGNDQKQQTIRMNAKLQSVNGTSIASTGKDFTSMKQLRSESSNKIHIQTEDDANSLKDAMTNPNVVWHVHKVKSTKRSNRPPVPYKTSTLQQEGSRALNNMPVQQVMRIAQQLYEQGLISYMRTDSTTLSQTAVSAMEMAVKTKYGPDALGQPSDGHSKKNKKSKNAQEAHEAIRPAIQSSGTFYPPEEITFTSPAAESLYRMIYQRTLASGMKPLITNQTSVTIQGTDAVTTAEYHFRTSGSVVVDPGYTIAYSGGRTKTNGPKGNNQDDEEDDDDNEDDINSSSGQTLPRVFEGQVWALGVATPTQHETQPPPRYTEASLVQELEALGVGRPSTYARIVQILRDRAYVGSQVNNDRGPTSSSSSNSNPKGPAISARRAAGGGNAFAASGAGGGRGPLVPSLSAFVVCSLLEKYCPNYVDPSFTAQMEDRLDRIASGEIDDSESLALNSDNEANDDDGLLEKSISASCGPHVDYLNEFYAGENGLAAQIKRMEETVSSDEARRADLPSLNPNSINGEPIIDAALGEFDHEDDIGLFIGPWGPYVQKKSNFYEKPLTAPLPPDMATDLSTITISALETLLSTKQSGGAIIGEHPNDGRLIRLKTGRFGAYLQWGDDGELGTTTHSLPKSMSNPTILQSTPTTFEDDDALEIDDIIDEEQSDSPNVITLDQADSPNAITLDQAVGLVSLPKTISTLNELPITAAIGPYGPYLKYNNKYVNLRDADILAIDAETAEQLVTDEIINKVGDKQSRRGVLAELGEKDGSLICVRSGRFGPYINWKKVNAKLPPSYIDNPESVPLDEAWDLILQKTGEADSSSSKRGKDKKSTENGLAPPPKRPLSAYLHFCAAFRPMLQNSGKSLGEVSKELSNIWAENSVESRQKYEDMAAASKAEYEAKKQEWEEMVARESEKEKPKVVVGKSMASRKVAVVKSSDGSPAKVKRPKSAYLFFCEAKRPEVSKLHKTLGEQTKELARMWNETSDRAPYEKLAAEDKSRYEAVIAKP